MESNQLLETTLGQQYFEATADPISDEIYDPPSTILTDPITLSELSITQPTSHSSAGKKAHSSIHTDSEIENQLFLHPTDVPIITSRLIFPPLSAQNFYER
jgi:hypothetical protein